MDMDRGNDNVFQPSLTIRAINSGGSNRMRVVLDLFNMMIQNDNIIERSMNDETSDNPVSEEFLNNLNEIDVSEEMISKGIECSICLDSFKEGEKCIQLPCNDNPHYFHCSKEGDECSGVKPWLQKQNTCPLCRTEFPGTTNPIPRTAEPEPETPEPIPESLDPRPTDLSPDQIPDPINNIIPDTIDNNIIEEQIIHVLDNFIRRVSNEINENEDTDLQRAIELSLQDNHTNE